MNLLETSDETAFRQEVRTWMQGNLCAEFEPLRNSAGMGAPGYDAALAKRWEQRLASGGWIGLGWPLAHGGRGLPMAQQIIFNEEYVCCGGPGRLGHIGETLMAPTLMVHGTAEQQRRDVCARQTAACTGESTRQPADVASRRSSAAS
jgi:acyl-CoA dehydrogenase